MAAERRCGFTLIELLVVIAIIALLISMMVPSLGRAMESANRLSCASNLRTMHMGVMLYVSDHDGQLPGPCWHGVPMRLSEQNTEPGVFRPLSAHLAVSGYLESRMENNMRIVPVAECRSATRAGYGDQVHYHANIWDAFGYQWSATNRLEPMDFSMLSPSTILIRDRILWPGIWIHDGMLNAVAAGGHVGRIDQNVWTLE